MIKIIEITRCSLCPYRKFKVGEIMQYETCEKANMGIRDTDIEALNTTGFPTWCPLKNANEPPKENIDNLLRETMNKGKDLSWM